MVDLARGTVDRADAKVDGDNQYFGWTLSSGEKETTRRRLTLIAIVSERAEVAKECRFGDQPSVTALG
jgi:hypothetical protein